MEINLDKGKDLGGGIKGRGGQIPQGATVIAKTLKKQSVMINADGDQIDPVTKRVIKRKVADDQR